MEGSHVIRRWICFADPEKNLTADLRLAEKAGKICREHGALEYRECAGDRLDAGVIAQTSLS